MKLTRIERRFMTSPQHAKQAVNRAKKLLHFASLEGKEDFLEVGCGSGAVSKYVASDYHLNVIGIDLDPELIELAKEGIHDMTNIHFLAADATHLPFPDSDFDIVLSFGVMHHISNWLDALKEIHRVLKPEGYFVYADIVYPRLVAKIARSFKHSYGVTTTHDLKLFVEDNNFSSIYASLSRSLLWNWCEAVYRRN
jgi:ubiquinone/menaquinone biosynthesis C-methylase UbiE